MVYSSCMLYCVYLMYILLNYLVNDSSSPKSIEYNITLKIYLENNTNVMVVRQRLITINFQCRALNFEIV